MAQADKKTFSVRLPVDDYARFSRLAEDLHYSDLDLGHILLCYAIPRWEIAVDEHIQRVKRGAEKGPTT